MITIVGFMGIKYITSKQAQVAIIRMKDTRKRRPRPTQGEDSSGANNDA
jgi:hypothetical protein